MDIIGQPATEFALKFAPLVFVRPGELRKTTWSEFDLDRAEWRIPAAPDVIELQLARAERDEARGAYNRAQRLDDRRKMMQAWADFLDELRGQRSVVPITYRAA
jgi:integrase